MAARSKRDHLDRAERQDDKGIISLFKRPPQSAGASKEIRHIVFHLTFGIRRAFDSIQGLALHAMFPSTLRYRIASPDRS